MTEGASNANRLSAIETLAVLKKKEEPRQGAAAGPPIVWRLAVETPPPPAWRSRPHVAKNTQATAYFPANNPPLSGSKLDLKPTR